MKGNKKKIFIEALEQRIMLDGAGASTALDVIDERNKEQLLNKNQKISKLSENKIEDNSQKLPFDQMVRDQKRNDRKQVVFIDSQVQDYQTLIDAFNKDTEVYLIQSNEDGFKKIDRVLKNDADISSLHIIGHGSAGKILFGNANLSNDTIKSYNHTLRSIGQSLTEDGDILFYGCNVAATDQGELLIKKISEITKADIAASDDITGKGGDWKLEKHFGLIGEAELKVKNYNHALGSLSTSGVLSGSGVTHIDNNVTMMNSGNVGLGASGAYATVGSDFGLAVEEQNVSVSSGDLISNLDVDSTYIWDDDNDTGNAELQNGANQNASSNITVNSYLMFLVDDSNKRASGSAGEVVFDGEIVGIFFDQAKTRAANVDGNTYHSSSLIYAMSGSGGSSNSADNDGGRMAEGKKTHSGMTNFFNTSQSHGSGASIAHSNDGSDWVSVSNYGSGTNNLLQFGAQNANTSAGDYIRILVKPTSNNAPVAAANTATVNEDDTITVTGDSATTLTYEANDTVDSQTDVEGDTSENNGTGVSFSSDGRKMFITGIDDNRIHEWTLSNAFDPTSKSYVDSVLLDWNNTDNSGDENYSNDQGDWVRGHAWKSDGTKLFVLNWDGGLSGDATATYRICSYDLTTPYDISTISKTNAYVDAPTSSNSYDTGITQSVRSFAMSNDGTKFFFINKVTEYIHQITFATAYDLSSNASSVTYDTSGAGTPRSIAFSANGKKLFIGDDTNDRVYQYNLSSAFDLSSTVSQDGYVNLVTSSDPFGIAFDHSGTKMFIHDIAGNDTVDVHTLKTPFNLIDIDGENDGDVLADDTDADGNTLTVTQIAVTGGSNSAVSSGSSYNSSGTSVTGTYGTLTIGADGTYTYVADQSAADALDPGDIVTDSFTYTVSDGTDTDTETLIVTVIGINDAPVADDEVDSVAVENTETVTDGALDVLFGDTDADDSSSLSVFSITATTAGGAETAVNIGTAYNSGYASVTGSYGTLRIGSDGTYQYIAGSSTGTEVFTYKVSDGSTTDDGTLTITVTNTAPVAQNDTGVVNEDATLTVADGSNSTTVAAATVDGSPLNVSSQLPNLRGITFNNDGTKMFLVGESSDSVSEYHLTTAFDVSTASLDSSFSVSGQEGKPMSVKFNNDGTKMFITGTVSDSIHEYTLSTAFDVSTASLEDSLNVSDKDLNPFGLDFNNDGTKMYFTGDSGNAIHEYNLSTGFDLSTASFNQEVNLGAYDVEPFGIEFSPDGTRMFIVGTRGNGIDEYVLSTGFDISTATHVCFLSTYNDASNPSGIAFNTDGSKMFIVGNNDGNSADQVDEYALASHFSLCNAHGTYTGDVIDSTNSDSRDTDADGQTLTVSSVRTGSSEGSGTAGTVGAALTGTYGQLTLNANGSYTYVANQDLADALDVGDMVTESFNYTVSDGSGGTDIAVITITIMGVNDTPVADDETNSVNVSSTLTVTDGTSDVLHGDTDADASASLTVTGIRTGQEGGSGTSGTVGTSLSGSYGALTIAADGTYTYVANSSGGIDYFTYTVSDGIGGTDTAQITITVNAAPVAADNTGIVNEDGTLTVADGASANSITTAAITYDENDHFNMSAVSGENRSAGLIFNNDGTKMYHAGNDDNAVKEYHLSTAYDVSTATYQGDSEQLTVTSQTNEPFGITFNNDGSKLYVAGNSNVYQYSLSTAYDVSTGSYDSVSFATGDSTSCGIRFNNDGTKLFVAGFAGGNIEEIHLSTAYDLSTASRSDSNRLDISAKETLPRDIEFNIDGTRMFVVGGQGKDITEYKLSAAYDVSTGTYVGEYNIRLDPNDNSVVDSEPFSILFNKMGTKMFMMGYGSDDVHEYNLTSPYNLINVKDEHDGDVLGDDTDVNSDTLTVTAVRTGSSEGNGTAGTVGAALTGTYGQLTLNSNGSYTYVANQSAADALDSGDVVTDSFNYTVSDGSLTDIAVLEITVIGINDDPVADDETNSVSSGQTLTVTDGTSDVLHGDTDADASASLSVTSIVATTASGSATAVTQLTSYNSGYTSVTGSYGTLRIGADGTYQYIAGSSAGTDVFTYTLSDGAAIDTGTLTITVNTTPVARNDTGTVNENGTLTVADGDNASSVTAASFVDDGANDPFEIHTEEGQPTGLRFNNDGTKFFMVGQSGQDVNEYALTTAFDISTSSYVRNYSFSSVETEPRDIAFNSDGTKMFIVGGDGSTIEVHEYALSTAFDVSSSSVSHTTSKTITSLLPGGSQCIDGYGLDFNTDGTKFFITGRTNNNVYEFTVSSGFDLTSTVAYDSSLDISSEAPKAQNIRFNNDGKKMFIVDNEGNDVNEYTLTTGFDISTATHKGSFSVSSQDGTPVGLDFNNDGTKMFVAGWDHDDINEYTLVSPFNLVDVAGVNSGDVIHTSSTDNYDTDADSDTLTVTSVRTGSSEGSGTAGTVGAALTGTYGQLTLNANGSYTYVANQSAADALDPGDIVTDSFNYTVSDGNGGTDIAVIQITVIGINDAPVAVNDTDAVNEDATITESSGSELLIADDTDADDSSSLTVTQIAVTGGSNSSVSSGSSYNSSGTQVTGTYGTLTVGADGTYTYVADQSAADALDASDVVTDSFTYTVSDGNGGTDTATLIITVTGVNDAPVGVADTGYIKEGGTLTVTDGGSAVSGTSTGSNTGDITDNDTDADASSSATITSITATTAGGSAQTTFSSNSETVTGQYGTLTINSNGSYSYVANSNISGLDAGDSNITDVFTYIVSDGTATSTTTLTINIIASQDVTARNDTGAVNEDATLTVDDGDNATTVTAASLVQSKSISGASDARFNNDGTKMFVLRGGSYDDIQEWTLTTAYNVSTASLVDSFDISSQHTNATGFKFNSDGTKFYITGGNNATVYEYDLSTAFDISASSYNNNNLAVSSQDSQPKGLAFNNNGTKMFLVGSNNRRVHEYNLSSAFDITSASHVDYFSVVNETRNPKNITFNSDGTRMFVTGGNGGGYYDGEKLYEYKLTTAFDVSTASYYSNFDIASDPTGISFNNDGSKMFIGTSNTVREYSLTSPFTIADVSGEHSGDVIHTSSTDNYDTDPDSDTLTVTAIRTGSSEGSGTAGSVGSALTGTYGQLTIAANGSYTYVANQSAADTLDPGDVVTDTFNYTVSDGQGETDIAVLTITIIGINDAPVADNETNSVSHSQTLTVTDGTSDVLHGDTDADASASLTVTGIRTGQEGGSGTAGTVGTSLTGSYGTLTIAADGTYTYVANSSAGTDYFTYTVSDGTATDTGQITITVAGNSAPVADNETNSVNEDGTVTVTDGTSDVLHGDTDADSDTLTVTQIAVTGGSNSSVSSGSSYNSSGTSVTGTYGTLTIGADGTYTYVADQSAADDLDASDTVTDSFTYTVSDGNGGTDTATLIFTITGINDAPVAVNDTDSVNEDATVTQSSGSGLLMADDSDADDDDSFTVTQIAVTGSSNSAVSSGSSYNSSGTSVTGTYGTLTVGADGTYTYVADQSAADDLDASDTATDSFTYTISDGDATDTATLIITITGVNDIPTASDKTVTTAEDTPYVFSTSDFGYTDADDDDTLVSITITTLEDAGALQYYDGSSWQDVTLNQVITATDISNNYLRLNPASNENGSPYTTFEFTVNDGDASSATPNTITVNVTPVNDDPVADNETNSVNEDATVTVTDGTSDILHGDTDADSDTLTVTQIAVTGGSNSSVASGSAYNSNGTSVTGTYGTLTVGADGTYTYVADQSAADALDAGDTVTDSFTYTVSDGNGGTDTATLIFTVTGVNDVPVADDETIYINENNTDASFGARTSQNITHTFADSDFTNYSDADADDGVGIRIKSLPTGTLSKISNGAVQSVNDYITNMSNLLYTPPANSEDDDSFTYRAYDGTTAGDTTRTITISVNAAPVAVNDTGSITAGDADAAGNVLSNDTDSDDANSVLRIRGVGAVPESSTMLGNANVGSAVTGTYGSLTIYNKGGYTYSVSGNANTVALRAGETATDVFSYKVMDDETNAGSKAIDIGTITFTITGIDGDAIGEPDPDEPPKIKEKKKDKKQKREERKELKRLKREKRLERKEFKIPKSNLEKNAEFNQGLKLIDLVAESKSLELKDKDKDIYLDKIIAKYSDKSLKVKFNVFDDEGNEVQKYYGEMKDGSPLPDWIKVDPKTGKTKTDIPKGVKMVEFKIIAIDAENNKKQVTVVLDAKKIAQDKEVLKQSRKIERAKKLEVTNDGSVKLNSINEEGKIDKTKTEVINEIKEIDELVKTIEPDEFLNLEAKVEKENFEIELPWQNLKVVLNNGQELPEWIKYDPKTGKVTATPPENVKTIDLKVIVENPDGELSVKDIKLNFVDKNAQETKNISDNETKFVSLSSQLSKEYSDWDDYGSQLIDRL